MKKLLLSVVAAALTVVGMTGVAALAPVSQVYADGETGSVPGNDYLTQITPTGSNVNLMGTLQTVINIVLGLVGVVAVVMMILGGISFITSQGDTNKVTKARNTILYGVVGLVIALLAFAIVNFVLGAVFNGGDGGALGL